jgi:hypothetical protein
MAWYLTEHVDSFTFCLRLVHFSSFSSWFSVPTFMRSYDSSPLFSIVGLACCKRVTTFRLPKIINALNNGSTMRAPARRAFHLLQAARQLTPFVRLKIQLGASQVTYSTGLTISTLHHLVQLRRVARFRLPTMSRNYSFTFLLSTNNQLISLNFNFLISDNKILEGRS